MSDLAKKADVIKGYENRGKYRDPIYGECTLYENPQTSHRIVCIDKVLNDKDALRKEIENRRKRILDKHEYILSLLDYSVDVISALCATSYLLHLYYETEKKSLFQDIVDRKNAVPPQNYKMGDLTHLMFNQVYAHEYLESKGIYHGDICPQNIGISKKDEYKIAWKSSDTVTPERLQLDKFYKKVPYFVSPQLYQALLKRNVDRKNFDSSKSDVFSLGLTILQAGLLKPIEKIYGPNDFDEATLQNYLDEFQAKYSENPLLCSTVANMLTVRETDRNSFSKIKSALPDYQQVSDYIYKLDNGLIEPDYDDEGSMDLNDSLHGEFNPPFSYDANAQAEGYGAEYPGYPGYPPYPPQGYPPYPPQGYPPYPPQGYPPYPYYYPPQGYAQPGYADPSYANPDNESSIRNAMQGDTQQELNDSESLRGGFRPPQGVYAQATQPAFSGASSGSQLHGGAPPSFQKSGSSQYGNTGSSQYGNTGSSQYGNTGSSQYDNNGGNQYASSQFGASGSQLGNGQGSFGGQRTGDSQVGKPASSQGSYGYDDYDSYAQAYAMPSGASQLGNNQAAGSGFFKPASGNYVVEADPDTANFFNF